MAEMKGIKLCGECGNYDWKKHKCKIGCNDDSNAQAPFYGDCPLPDVVPKSEVAREIFEEIERAGEVYENRAETVCYFPNGFLAELKKKYTESEDKE